MGPTRCQKAWLPRKGRRDRYDLKGDKKSTMGSWALAVIDVLEPKHWWEDVTREPVNNEAERNFDGEKKKIKPRISHGYAHRSGKEGKKKINVRKGWM